MRNVTSMLQPGGTFIIHALHQCKAYKCGDRMFPGSNLTIDDMHDAMLENGFAPSSIDAQVIPCRENNIYGYSGILTASGRKAVKKR
jgi:NNMT/PNMT/TEMT family protein